MPKTNFEVEATTAQAVAQLRALNGSMQEVVKSAADLVQKHKEGEAAGEKHTSALTAGFNNMLGGITSCLAPAALLARTVASVTDELNKSDEAAHRTADAIRALVGAARSPAEAAEMEAMIKGMKGPGTYAERAGAVQAFRGQAMGTATLAQQGEFAALAMQAGEMGQNPQEVAGLEGMLHRFAPGKSEKEIADLAIATRRAAGVHAGDLTGGALQRTFAIANAAGQPIEETLGTMIAGMKAGQTPRALQPIIEELTSTDVRSGTAAQRRLHRMPQAEREAALIGSQTFREAVFHEGAPIVERMLNMKNEEVRDLRINAPGTLARGLQNVEGSPTVRMDNATRDQTEANENRDADDPSGARWGGYMAGVRERAQRDPSWRRWATTAAGWVAGMVAGPYRASAEFGTERRAQFVHDYYGGSGGSGGGEGEAAILREIARLNMELANRRSAGTGAVMTQAQE